MDKKKQDEKRCLDTTMAYVQHRMNKRERAYVASILPVHSRVQQSERPDFVINVEGKSYLIEHFLIDFCYDGPKNNQSKSKIETHHINGIFNTYHDPEICTIRDENKESALKDIEMEVNRLINISNGFNYNEYVYAFTTVFLDHYDRIESYKRSTLIENRSVKMGFLIEFHCDSFGISARLNGAEVRFCSSQPAFPITQDIIDIIEQSKNLDFVIISQYKEGVPVESQCVRIFEPNNIKRSLDIQQIKVFDEAFYPMIKKEVNLRLSK